MAESKLMRTLDIVEEYRIPKTTLRRLVADDEFPQPIRLGGRGCTGRRGLAWYRVEVEEWAATRERANLKP